MYKLFKSKHNKYVFKINKENDFSCGHNSFMRRKKSITKMLRSIKCTNCWTYAWVLSICYAYNKQLKKKGPEND